MNGKGFVLTCRKVCTGASTTYPTTALVVPMGASMSLAYGRVLAVTSPSMMTSGASPVAASTDGMPPDVATRSGSVAGIDEGEDELGSGGTGGHGVGARGLV